MTNQIISIKVHDKSTSNNLKKFLQKNILENKRKYITTGHHPIYIIPIKNLGFENINYTYSTLNKYSIRHNI
jgi:hypothetical protein